MNRTLGYPALRTGTVLMYMYMYMYILVQLKILLQFSTVLSLLLTNLLHTGYWFVHVTDDPSVSTTMADSELTRKNFIANTPLPPDDMVGVQCIRACVVCQYKRMG